MEDDDTVVEKEHLCPSSKASRGQDGKRKIDKIDPHTYTSFPRVRHVQYQACVKWGRAVLLTAPCAMKCRGRLSMIKLTIIEHADVRHWRFVSGTEICGCMY